MEKYQKLLISFMKEKNRYINKAIGGQQDNYNPLYFGLLDEEIIKGWNDEESKSIYNKIKAEIENLLRHYYPEKYEIGIGLQSFLCPFCLKYLCGICPYGKIHGECDDDTSNFNFITEYDNCLTIEVYDNIITKIESK